MLSLYSLLQWIGGTIWISFATIPDRAVEYYGTSLDTINMFSLSFLILQLPMAPLSSYMLRKSYHWTIMIAYIFSMVGVWVKVLAFKNVYLSLAGQCLIGAMNSITLAACATLTSIWFEKRQQTLAVGIASTSNLLGAGCGLVFSPYFTDIPTLLYIHAGYTSFSTVVNMLLSRKSGLSDRSELETDYKKELKLVFNDWYLLTLIFFISSGLAIAYAVSGILYQLLSPYGITENESGWIGFAMYLGGIIGGLLTSLLTHNSKSFINPVRVFSFISMVGVILWASLARYYYGNLVSSTICGLGLFGFMPLGIQAAVEQNKNLEESIPTNLIYLTAQAMSVAYTYPIIYFYGWVSLSGLWLAVVFAIMSFCTLVVIYCPKFIIKYKQPLIRDLTEQKEEVEIDDNNN